MAMIDAKRRTYATPFSTLWAGKGWMSMFDVQRLPHQEQVETILLFSPAAIHSAAAKLRSLKALGKGGPKPKLLACPRCGKVLPAVERRRKCPEHAPKVFVK